MDHIAQHQNTCDVVWEHGPSSFASAQRDTADCTSTSNTVPENETSSLPLSSPQSLSPLSPFLPVSPNNTSPSIDNPRDDFSSAGRCLPDLNSGKEITEHATSQDDSLSGSRKEAGGPSSLQEASPKSPNIVMSASEDHTALQPSPANSRRSESRKENVSWTKRRLRSNAGKSHEIQNDHPREGSDMTTKIKRGTKRKASTSHEELATMNRTSPEPLVSLVNQIGRSNTMADMRKTVQELNASPHRARALVEGLHSRKPIQIDTPPVQIIQATPTLAREIEHSAFNEQLSRIYFRIAIANFYCAYRAAHTNPCVFLQELDRHPSQQTSHLRTRNRTKRAEIKDRFIELVFSQWTSKRDHRRDSTRVNNWQKTGRPWFELIDRFGTGILLLVPEDVTNCRQVFHSNTWLFRRAILRLLPRWLIQLLPG